MAKDIHNNYDNCLIHILWGLFVSVMFFFLKYVKIKENIRKAEKILKVTTKITSSNHRKHHKRNPFLIFTDWWQSIECGEGLEKEDW